MAATPAIQRVREQTLLQEKATSKSLLDQMDAVFEQISRRAFQLFEDNGRIFGRDFENWLRAESELLRPLSTELAESDKSLEIKAEVSGFSEKELEISVEPRRIVIAGEHQSTDQGAGLKTEKILRIVNLPVEIETDKATATLKKGVLVVAMSKATKARSVRIKPAVA